MKNKREIQSVFKEFLNIHWLRPESAFMKTYDYMQLRNIKIKNPSMDITCGDGVSSFIWAGGKFGLSFDMFQSVKTEGFFKNVDVFDHFKKGNMNIDIQKRPDWHFTVGVDRLDTAIAKAKLLNFYKETYVHDCNKPLPFPDNAFETIFSTTFFAIKNQALFLKEIHRILKKGGRFIARIHDKNFRDNLLYGWYLKHNWQWAKILDRGIWHDNKLNVYTFKQWTKKFNKAGLHLVKHFQYLPFAVYRMYTIGLRPLFPGLIEMYKRLSIKDRIEVKKIWLENLFKILAPFCNPSWMKPLDDMAMMHMVILKRH